MYCKPYSKRIFKIFFADCWILKKHLSLNEPRVTNQVSLPKAYGALIRWERILSEHNLLYISTQFWHRNNATTQRTSDS